MLARAALLLTLAAPALLGQSAAVVDSLVQRATQNWGVPPTDGWRSEWSVVRGDSSALTARTADIAGSDRTGVYTVTVRRERFAAPVVVGRLRIGYERAETVAVRMVARGTVLSADDVAAHRATVWGMPDAHASTASTTPLVGAAVRRAIMKGEAIRASDMTGAPVVFAGDTVTADIMRNGVRLALVGTALHNAALGARVSIRLDRGRRFAGIATGRNTVRLD